MALDNIYKSIEDVNQLERDELGIRNEDKGLLATLDPSERNIFLQKKIEELHRQIQEIQAKQDLENNRIKDNNSRIDEIDNELPDIREKIENKKADLESRGTDLDDHDNAFVKELDILISQYDNKKEIKESYKDENAKSKSSIAEDEPVIKELEKQMALLETLRQQNNKQRIAEAKENADKHVGRGNVITQSNAVLTFLEALFQAAERRSIQKDAEKEVEKKVNLQIAKEDFQVSKEMSKVRTNFEDEEPAQKVESNSKEAFIFLAHTDGKDIIRIIDASEAEKYTQSGKDDDIINSVFKEKDLPIEDRKTSIVTLKHSDKEQLFKELEPVAGKGLKFPEELHEFVSTEERIQKVTDIIFSKCKVDGWDGGNYYSRHIANAKENEKKEKSEQQQKAAEEKVDNAAVKKQDNGYQSSNETAPKAKSFGWNVFDYIAQKFHLTKDKMRQEDVQKLEAGEPTGLYKLKNGQVARLRPSLDPITNDKSVVVEIRKKSPDYKGVQKTLNLSETDVQNLKKFGVLDHPIKYNGKTGYLYRDRETNNFLVTYQRDIRINKSLKEQLGEERIARLKEGKAVHVDNLKDEKGQSYTGWIMLDPKRRQFSPVKKEPAFFVDKEYQIQVKNNNDGARADSVKDDKDAVLKSKQQKTDDAPKEEETKRVYKDYSQNDSTTAENTKTKNKKI